MVVCRSARSATGSLRPHRSDRRETRARAGIDLGKNAGTGRAGGAAAPRGSGTETDTGLIIRVDQPTGGPLYLDRGRLVFDPDGNVVFEAGPHPSLHGDFGGICASLAP